MLLFPILFGASLTVAASYSLGRLLLPREEDAALRFVAGSALLSLLVFLLCAAGVANRTAFLLIGAAILAAGFRPRFSFPRINLYLAIFAAYFGLYFVHALAPETSPDGVTYHLGLVSRYLREGGFRPITTDLYASMPQATEMLFLFAFAFGKHSAAKLVHFAFLLALPAAMVSYSRRFGFPAAGLCAAVLVFAAPVAGVDGSSAYNDLAAAAAVFALFYLLELWDGESARALLPIGLAAGFAFAIKYTLFTAPLYAFAVVAWRSRRRAPHLALLTACAAAVALPWLIKNWLWVANPFSPFLNAWFPNPFVHLSFESDYTTFLRLPEYYRLGSYLDLPLALTLQGNLTGVLGPVFLLAPAALLALREPLGRRLLLAAAVFLTTYPANLGCRFLLPALPFVALSLGLVLTRVRLLAPAVALLHALSAWPAIQELYGPPINFRFLDFPLRAALRLDSEEEYLKRTLPSYSQARLIEQHVPAHARVLALDDVATAYTTRDILGPYHSSLSWLARDLLLVAFEPIAAPTRRFRFRLAEPAARLRILQTAPEGRESWNIYELRALRNGVEQAVTLATRLNPWDTPLALDRNPVTRWRTWQFLHPRMSVDVAASSPVDEIEILSSEDQPHVRLTLDGRSPEVAIVPPPPDLRRAATAQIKRLRIHYIYVSDANPLASDLGVRASEWGLTAVAAAAGASLFALR